MACCAGLLSFISCRLRLMDEVAATLLWPVAWRLLRVADLSAGACAAETLPSQADRISGLTGEYSFSGEARPFGIETPDFAGEVPGLVSPDLFWSEARLPYCLAFSRLASRICSESDVGQLWFVALLRLRPLAEVVRVALVLRCR